MNHRVAIIGGGLSGLATAAQLRLQNPAVRITLFEGAERVGGVIHTEFAEGFLIDHGADMFATTPPAALELCRDLGLEADLIEPEMVGRGARIVRGGKLVPIPDGFVLMRATQRKPMLTTPLLSWRAKLRFFAERFIPPHREHFGGLNKGGSNKVDPNGMEAESYDESVADFVRRRMGGEVLDHLVAPLAAGIYTADITKLSMRATMGPIVQMEQKYGSLARATAARRRSGEDSVERASTGARYGRFRAFRGGMIELIGGLSGSLGSDTIQVNRPVRSLVRNEQQWIVHCEGASPQRFDHVVVAIPPKPASVLLREIAPIAANGLTAIESASTAIVVLGVRKSDIEKNIETFGFVIPQSERRQILAGSFASHKFAGRAPDSHVLIRVFVGGAMQPELLEKSDDQLVQMVRGELRELIGLGGEPVITRVVRWNDAMPQYHVGHLSRVAKIERAIQDVPAMTLVSNALHGVGIAPVIRSAKQAALGITQSLEVSRDPPRDHRARS